ncbi:MAG: D-alanyl-D-alanine carboxypeptidase [Clostridia bacterium]|nr:D-alanyl-D-alanine carboxypeptidase [Clostridia bacterium]
MKKKLFIVFFLEALIFLQTGALAAVTGVPDHRYVPSVAVSFDSEWQPDLSGAPDTGCKAVFVADPGSGKVFYEKNAHTKMYPASTTKMLTALVVIENCSLSETAEVSRNAVDLVPSGYSTANLYAGEVFDIETMLYALLIPSANDAAYVLAEHVSGSVDAFAELCNKRAKELGCEDLHFVNPNGIHSENHYCTAYDLYLIAKECCKHEIFREIVKTKRFSLPATDIHPENDRIFSNTNALLLSGTYYYEYCTGIKTGRTNPAGECLVASATRNGVNLISVVLGGQSENSKGLNDRFYDTKRLFEYVYNGYSHKTVARSGDPFLTLEVENASPDSDSIKLVIGADITAFLPDSLSRDEIPFSISLKKDITAPIYKGQLLGEITFYADGTLIKTDLLSDRTAEAINREYRYLLWNIAFLRQ